MTRVNLGIISSEFSASGLRGALLATSPYAMWPLDDVDPYDDATGNNRPIVGVGVTSQAVAGPYGTYVDLPATGSSLLQDGAAGGPYLATAMQLTGARTWFFVVRADTLPTNPNVAMLWSKFGSGAYEWEIRILPGGSVQITGGTFLGQVIRAFATPTGALATGSWCAVCIKTDSAMTTSTNGKINVNGTWQTITTGTGTGTYTGTTANALIFGRRFNGTFPFDGAVAFAAVWTRELSDAEVDDIMAVADSDGWF